MNRELTTARNLTPDNVRQLKAQGMLALELDALCAGDTWLKACIAAVGEAPDWLRGQAEDSAYLPALIADHRESQAGTVFLAQAAAAAAAEAWQRGAADAGMELARRAAQRWSSVERIACYAPQVPVRPLATLRDSLKAERALHDVRAWAPVEDMVLQADASEENNEPTEPARKAVPAVSVSVKTWGCTPAGTGPLTLVLETVPDRQPGLWRSPSAGLTAADESFLDAAQDAWTWAVTNGGLAPDTSVRWHLTDASATRVARVTGNSAGLAFAVALHQAGVSWRRLRVLDKETGYLGAVSATGAIAMPSPHVSPKSNRHVRYLIAPAEQAGNQAEQDAKLTLKLGRALALKLRPVGNVSQAISLGRRPVRVRRGLGLAAACSLAVIALGTSFAAIRSGQSDASSNASAAAHNRQAQALALARQATGMLASDPPQAIAAAAAAYQLAPADPTIQAAVIAAAGSDPRARHYLSPAGPVTQLSLSGDGSLMAALLTSGKVEIWSLTAKTPRLLPVPQPLGTVSAIGFLDGGSSLVTAGSRVTIINPVHGTSRQFGRNDQGITALSVSPSSPDFVTSSPAGIRLWNSTTGAVQLLSPTPSTVVSLAPDGQSVLTGSPSGELRLISATGSETTATLPSAATSVLLSPSGNAYALTKNKLYGFSDQLRQAHPSLAVPVGSTLALRPAATARMLTEGHVLPVPRPAEIVMIATNAAFMLPDDPAHLTVGSGSNVSINSIGIPVRGFNGAILASDGTGTTAATMLASGQIRISTFDLTSNPHLRVLDLASAAVVGKSTIAVASGLTFERAFVALLNPSNGTVSAVKTFTHAPTPSFERPAISTHYIADTGNPASSIDLWQITGHHIATLASNLQTSFPVHAFAIDETAGLLFDGGGSDIEVRELKQPSTVVFRESMTGTVNCLSADPVHRAIYACTTKGITVLKYKPAGTLDSPAMVDPAIAQSVIIGPDGKDLVIEPHGVSYLPEGFTAHGNDSIDMTEGQSSVLGAAATPTAVAVSSLNFDMRLYSATSGTDLDSFQLGPGQFVSVLWPDGDGLISGSTFDGSLFTLPPTRTADAAKYGCTLLADPAAEWQADYGRNSAAARLLPPSGGC